MLDSVFAKRSGYSNIREIEETDYKIICFTFKEINFKAIITDFNCKYNKKIEITCELNAEECKNIPPHFMCVMKNIYSICLIEKKQFVLSSMSLEAYMELLLDRLEELLCFSDKEKYSEYRKEFLHYWDRYSDISFGNLELYIPTDTAKARELFIYKDNDSNRKIVCESSEIFNKLNTPNGGIEKAIYIPIIEPMELIPPLKVNGWDKINLLNIFSNTYKNVISEDSYKILSKIKIAGYSKMVVFSMYVEEGIMIAFAGIINFKINDKKPFIKKIQENFVSFLPVVSRRMDMRYLMERSSGKLNSIDSKKILIIGCGSVGSYILAQLVKLGITDITISDEDCFESGNSLRHVLGAKYDKFEKTVALKFYFEHDNPTLKIYEIGDVNKIADNEKRDFLNKFDLIIVAIGSSDEQRRFNKIFAFYDIQPKVIFNWLDAAGKGCHAILVDYAYRGCFNCLFIADGESIPNNKLSFADGSENLILNGCNGTFSPYGNEILVRNTSMITSLIKYYFLHNVENNIAISIKNDFDKIESAISIIPIFNKNFFDERCEFCGNKQ